MRDFKVKPSVDGDPVVTKSELDTSIDEHSHSGSAPQVFVGETQPTSTEDYIWIQTGLGPDGEGFTFWFEAGE